MRDPRSNAFAPGAAPMLIGTLLSGGIITTYGCTSACGHCLYNCSPRRSKAYIGQQELLGCLVTLRDLGCTAVHIGGGEPFLNRSGLKMVVQLAVACGIAIDYVETNGVWYRDHAQAVRTLEELRSLGLTRLLLSISPLHNAFVPFRKTKGVLAACREAGLDVLPWTMDFFSDCDRLDDSRPHDMDTYCELFGEDYLCRIPSRYWIHPGGRALRTFQACTRRKPATDIVREHARGCDELVRSDHFHFDLYGNYIPGLCAGLAIRRQDLGQALDPDLYPLLTTLHARGIGGLFELATSDFGFLPTPRGYSSKCDLCADIRRFLVRTRNLRAIELQPVEFYDPD